MPIGWLYITYHLLREPGNDHWLFLARLRCFTSRAVEKAGGKCYFPNGSQRLPLWNHKILPMCLRKFLILILRMEGILHQNILLFTRSYICQVVVWGFWTIKSSMMYMESSPNHLVLRFCDNLQLTILLNFQGTCYLAPRNVIWRMARMAAKNDHKTHSVIVPTIKYWSLWFCVHSPLVAHCLKGNCS